MSRLFDPVVRWWTRGALVDEVHAGELRALRQRVADVDIIEAYLVYVTRWMIDVQLSAARQGMQLPRSNCSRHSAVATRTPRLPVN